MTVFTKSTYRKARAHYIARAAELHSISQRVDDDPWGSADKTNAHYWAAVSMAQKIVDRGRREKGLFKMRSGVL